MNKVMKQSIFIQPESLPQNLSYKSSKYQMLQGEHEITIDKVLSSMQKFWWGAGIAKSWYQIKVKLYFHFLPPTEATKCTKIN